MGYTSQIMSKLINNKDFFQGKKILTLGTLYPYLSNSDFDKLLKIYPQLSTDKFKFSKSIFIDCFNAQECHSLDVSDYQKSEIILNLNKEIPSTLHSKYDIVIDFGTLEHLSNFRIAFENICMLLKPNGMYFFSLPCNNWIDHGFFQFSPTFFFDLCNDNSDSLELIDLFITANSGNYDLININPGFKRSLYSTSQKLNIAGIIRKIGAQISFDINQTKYKMLHVDNSIPELSVSTLRKKILRYISHRLSESKIIPLRVKKLIFEFVYNY